MTIPDTGVVSGYSVAASSTFNGSFTEFQQVPYKIGYKSPTAKFSYNVDTSFSRVTRFLFNPNDYTASLASVDDSKNFWVKIAPINSSGVVGSYSAPTLLMPYNTIPNRLVNISGTIGASLVEIQLPCDFSAPSIQVEGSDIMEVAFEPNGGIYYVNGITTSASPLSSTTPVFNQLFLKGSDAAVTFSIAARAVNSPTI